MTNELRDLYEQHAGKVSDKWTLYLEKYNELFNSFRDAPINLFEIGIQNGGSLELWAKYFNQCENIIGCDVDPKCDQLKFDDGRIATILGDANAEETKTKVLTKCEKFDIIIDDGSHTSHDIIKTFSEYFPHLKKGGLFIAEDLHCSYWEAFEGGIYHPLSSTSFFKRLVDLINCEHWHIDSTRRDALQSFEQKYNCLFNEEMLRCIHSVEFVNSMCIIRKNDYEFNQLGTRMFFGSDSLVCKPASFNPPKQDTNIWSNNSETFEDTILDWVNNKDSLREHVHVQEEHIRAQEEHIRAQEEHIRAQDEHSRAQEKEIRAKKELIQSMALSRFKSESLTASNPLRGFIRMRLRCVDNLLPRARLIIDDLPLGIDNSEAPAFLVNLLEKRIFDVSWYLTQYPEVLDSELSPFLHYLKYGWKEGKNPSKNFDVTSYLQENPDMVKAGIEPLTHYFRSEKSS